MDEGAKKIDKSLKDLIKVKNFSWLNDKMIGLQGKKSCIVFRGKQLNWPVV